MVLFDVLAAIKRVLGEIERRAATDMCLAAVGQRTLGICDFDGFANACTVIETGRRRAHACGKDWWRCLGDCCAFRKSSVQMVVTFTRRWAFGRGLCSVNALNQALG